MWWKILDGDGTEDHYDDDIDGDGFSNADEIAYGSNPLDPNSLANAAPNSLELNGTTILENQPAGTRVGQLRATDPDGNVSLNFRFAEGEGAGDNALFAIDQTTPYAPPRYLTTKPMSTISPSVYG